MGLLLSYKTTTVVANEFDELRNITVLAPRTAAFDQRKVTPCRPAGMPSSASRTGAVPTASELILVFWKKDYHERVRTFIKEDRITR
jgi:hypothetical protein